MTKPPEGLTSKLRIRASSKEDDWEIPTRTTTCTDATCDASKEVSEELGSVEVPLGAGIF